MVRVPPGKAMVVYGRRLREGRMAGYQIVTEGSRFVVPIIETFEFLSLDIHESKLILDNVRTFSGSIPVKARITASIKVQIPSDPTVLMVAAEHLLHTPGEEVATIAERVIEGTIRSVYNSEGIDKLGGDMRMTEVLLIKMASQDLMNVGISIYSLIINDVTPMD